MTNTIGSLNISVVTDVQRARSPLFESLRIPSGETLYPYAGAPSRSWTVKASLISATVFDDYAALENMEASAVPYYYNLYVSWAAQQWQGFGKISDLKLDSVAPSNRIDCSFTLNEVPSWGRTYMSTPGKQAYFSDLDF